MVLVMLAVALAAALAWWTWRDRLADPRARVAASARATGLAALLLLILDPGVAAHGPAQRALVLLDNSVSMHASGGHAADAARLAATLGDTTTFGELAPGEPGGASRLQAPLTAAGQSDRPIVIVTDGEIADVAGIPPDLLAQATVQVLPRPSAPDIAITDVEAPLRLSAGDTLSMDVEAARTDGAPDTVTIRVQDSAVTLLHAVIRFHGHRGRVHVSALLPRGLSGEQWLRIAREGAPDSEPGDDVRWWRLVITATPGVVVLADTPDFDARALYRAVKDVVDVPVRGYVQLQPGQWRRMDDLRSVNAAEVAGAASHADLLAVRGDIRSWRASGKARLLWPMGTQVGDWYLRAGGISPVSGAFSGIDPDSLPPATAVGAIAEDSLHGWIGAVARLSRRGLPVTVISGHVDRTGRTVMIGADGLYRWALRGGMADEAWRTTIAGAATWLLAGPEGDSVRARIEAPVVQRGHPVHFRWTGTAPPIPLALHLQGPAGARDDTLRFDGAGEASLALGVGRYHYALDGGGSSSFAVEPYADELVPAPMTLQPHVGVRGREKRRRSLRDVAWLFALAVAGFAAEWMLRRSMGLT